jgi:hypothetical protein
MSMNPKELHALLQDVAAGNISSEAAHAILLGSEQNELKLDPLRLSRTNVGEVVYGQGKTLEQIRASLEYWAHITRSWPPRSRSNTDRSCCAFSARMPVGGSLPLLPRSGPSG